MNPMKWERHRYN